MGRLIVTTVYYNWLHLIVMMYENNCMQDWCAIPGGLSVLIPIFKKLKVHSCFSPFHFFSFTISVLCKSMFYHPIMITVHLLKYVFDGVLLRLPSIGSFCHFLFFGAETLGQRAEQSSSSIPEAFGSRSSSGGLEIVLARRLWKAF